MKKFHLFFILILSAFLLFSCSNNDDEEELADGSGHGASQENGNGGENGLPEAVTDDEKTDTASEYEDSDNDSDNVDISDTDISENDDLDPNSDQDTDPEDTDIPDTETSDNDDDTGTADTDTDSGDSQPDDDADADTSEPAFPECSPTSAKPCVSGNLIWSETKKTKRTQGGCNTDCNNLNEAGYSSGWRLPTINELRTLVQNCDKTVPLPDGLCKVSDTCNTTDCKEKNCKCSSGTDYSKLGDTDSLWSSTMNNKGAWYINFNNAEIDSTLTSERKSARCVHEIK